MNKLIIICALAVLITATGIGCINSSNRLMSSNESESELYSSEVIGLLSKQVDSASSSLLKFKNFKKEDEEYNKDGSKAYNYALNFTGSIVASSDCYWNIPSDHLYDGQHLKKIFLDVTAEENPIKLNSYPMKSGLGVPIIGTAYFREEGNKLIIFDFTVKIAESVISK
ncbi:hypothetical protein N180_01255 [Pedobacter antarcticus 4BY]|uniref:Lipoprotein n=2 Tax=Pedobacter antarcticus TaxID=34086 RepID=A0A081PC67_9SPHI|nr:hypothetical protein [Pedobacter antarcticus]KEQ28290.1 hypothetical protein N180_01255 [Pedobacter antarcticus 4BY]SFE47865.1 hypothetical protein SAMN03003324_00617 [Pedobacter antarcticus]